MTEGPTPAAAEPAPTASASQRRKPRRKRNVGKKNDPPSGSNQQKKTKGSGKKSNNNSGPPPPPQIKIIIRNIQNAEKFGTVKSVLEGLVAKLIETCVEQKANNQYHIELDRAAFRHLITEEEKIEERRQLLIREKAQREKEAKEEGKENDEADGSAAEQDQDVEMEDAKEEETAAATDEEKTDDNKLDVILAPKTESSLPTLTARPSYVVPPRKTRRRGERGGIAYVLLIGPKIEKKKAPPADPTSTSEEPTDVTKPEDSMEEEKSPEGESEDATTTDSKKAPEAPAPEKVINYPQELAKGRLLLSNAIKALIELVKEDSKSQEFDFSGCIVEQSMNGKTWKVFPNSNNSRPDRREGTIEGTADFKEWLQKTANQKEELKARPKPAPGGGMAATSNALGSDEVEEDGQIVSSLVQHLRAKKLESKRKKSQKKKKKDENNKASKQKGEAATEKKKRNEKKNRKNNNAANGKKTDAAAAAAKKAKRKKKERAKKAKATATAGGAKAPTALLKPQPTAT